MLRFAFCIAVLLSVASLPAAELPSPDWKKVAAETLDHFSALLRIDTSNPPGNETRAATYIQKALAAEGIPSRLFALEADRANLVARLGGNGTRKPLLIMGHTDVVGVQREKWTLDPFGALRRDGYIYGRGALDDKDNLTAALIVMLLLKRTGVKLDRDVIFLAEAGEEGTTAVGIDFMVSRHWNEIEAEYALAEGGGGVSRADQVRYMTVSTTEKVPRGVTLVARGTAGHGSAPRQDNAVVRIASAVSRVGAWQAPMRLNDTTRAYFERLATISTPEEAARYNNLGNPARAPEIERYFARNEIMHNSMLRTSVSPNIIRAGFRINVIPSEAEAVLDIRALPDEDMTSFYATLRKVIDDPSIELVPPKSGRPAGAPTRLDTEMFRALERVQQRVYPGAITLPMLLAGATDMAQLRARGVQAYGIGPIVREQDRLRGAAHGDDEKILETSLHKFVEFLWHAVLEAAASKQ